MARLLATTLLTLLLSSALCASPPQSTTPARPNVLLIVLDDVGLDKLAMYGSTAIQGGAWNYDLGAGNPQLSENLPALPNLNRMANQGVRFTHAYASPQCSPTRAQILSGRYGHETGMLTLSDLTPGYTLPPINLLPQALHAAGYRTGVFGKWHLTATPDETCHALSAGFEIFRGHMRNNGTLSTAEFHHYRWKRVSAGTLGGPPCDPLNQPVEGPIVTQYDAAVTQDDASRFLERFRPGGANAGESFFAQVSFAPPHLPLQLPPRAAISAETLAQVKAINGWDDAAYDANVAQILDPVLACDTNTAIGYKSRLYYRAMLESVDYYVGQLLGSNGSTVTTLPNTVVLVVGDNGTVGELQQTVASPSSPYGLPLPQNHGKRTLYEHGIRVPLLAYGPATWVAAGPQTSEQMVSTVDLWRTVAEIAGLNTVNAPRTSKSFRHALLFPRGGRVPADARQFVYQEIASDNGFRLGHLGGVPAWLPCAPSQSVACTGSSMSYMRTVISRDGWKYLRRCAPDGAFFQPCGAGSPVSCPNRSCGLPSACTVMPPVVPTDEIYRVFGSPLAEPNELYGSCSPNGVPRTVESWLRCTMQGISGS